MTKHIKRTVLSISLFGETTVGKTCICSVFSGMPFKEGHVATIGVDKMNAEVEIKSGEKIRLKIWDTAGQERFRSVGVTSLKHTQGAVVVFDLTAPKTFEKVIYWIEQIKDFTEKLPIALFGNKSDLTEMRKVKQENIDEFCIKHNLPYFETSAKNNTGLKEGFTEIANLAYYIFLEEDSKKGQQLRTSIIKNNKKKKCC